MGYLDWRFCEGVAASGVAAVAAWGAAWATNCEPVSLLTYGLSLIVCGYFLMPTIRIIIDWRKNKKDAE